MSMQILFDSRSRSCKEPFGCIKAGETLSLKLYVKDAGIPDVLFLLEHDGGETARHAMHFCGEEGGALCYACHVVMHEPGLYFYHFSVQGEGYEQPILRDRYNKPTTGEGGQWQLTCYRADAVPPESFYGQVMYQIFPDRFNRVGSCDTTDKLTPFFVHDNPEDIPVFWPNEEGEILNNDFFGGNLAGIRAKLPYLKELGVTVLYLNPIFKAFSNHRYDTADYKTIDPLLGTNDDFKDLCRAAHALGMRVLLDGVFSHTGSDSVYFDIHNRFGGGAYHNPDSPYRSWYQFEEYPHRYTGWWGIKTLPCVEETNPDYMQYIIQDTDSVVKHWLRSGADGWRLDVADELPDDFLTALYDAVKREKPDSLVLGEVWEDASNKISYGQRRRYLQGGVLDGVMNYVWRDAVLRFVRGELAAEDMNETVLTLCENYPSACLHSMMNLLSTHDTPRILTTLGIDTPLADRETRAHFILSDEARTLAKNRLAAAAFLLFALPGSACIYYGDEIGMQGFEDPFNRAYMGERAADNEVLALFKSLAGLKNSCLPLQRGELIPAFAAGGVFAFYRSYLQEAVLCVVNVSSVPYHLFVGGRTVLYANRAMPSEGQLLLQPYGSAVVQVSVTESQSLA